MTTAPAYGLSTVRTWADGFGRWYAAVPAQRMAPRYAAANAILAELDARGEIGEGFTLRLEEAPQEWGQPGYVTHREELDR